MKSFQWLFFLKDKSWCPQKQPFAWKLCILNNFKISLKTKLFPSKLHLEFSQQLLFLFWVKSNYFWRKFCVPTSSVPYQMPQFTKSPISTTWQCPLRQCGSQSLNCSWTELLNLSYNCRHCSYILHNSLFVSTCYFIFILSGQGSLVSISNWEAHSREG